MNSTASGPAIIQPFRATDSANYTLVINLDPTGTNKLFTMAGIWSIQPRHPMISDSSATTACWIDR